VAVDANQAAIAYRVAQDLQRRDETWQEPRVTEEGGLAAEEDLSLVIRGDPTVLEYLSDERWQSQMRQAATMRALTQTPALASGIAGERQTSGGEGPRRNRGVQFERIFLRLVLAVKL